MIRVGVVGAAGRMGREVCRVVSADADLELVAAVDPSHAGQVVEGITLAGSLDALTEAGAEVAVEFTRPEVAAANIAWCVAHGLHVVSGTTGFEPDPTWAEQRDVGVFIAANFAIGAVLLMRLRRGGGPVPAGRRDHRAPPCGQAGRAVGNLDGHRAPGGGGPGSAGSRRRTLPRSASREPEAPTSTGIRVHSVRLPGLVAHQEVILGGLGQTLTIRHDSFSHVSFMPGVLMAVKAVRSRPGLTVGLDALLEGGNG